MTKNDLARAMDALGDRHILEAGGTPKRRTGSVLRRVAVIAAAAVLCLALSLPALAASDRGYELLYAAVPALAQRFRPVRLSCEDDGIQMEVLAASVRDDTAEAYIALRDLAGDRLDGTADLFDSWSFHTSYDSMGACRMESYDEDTGTAVFYVYSTAMDGQELPERGSKATFSVHRILSGKQAAEGVPLGAALKDLPEDAATRPVTELRGGSFGQAGSSAPVCLVPPSEPLLVPADGVTVTAAGWADGQLRIQVRYEDILRTDNHGFLYRLDENGEAIYADSSFSFWDDDGRSSIEEYVFELDPQELDPGAFFGDFYTASALTEGNWQVTFPLEAEDAE